jgi:putative acetyltransferase
MQAGSEHVHRLEIQEVPPDHPDLQQLIRQLDAELLTLYPAEGIFGVDFSHPSVAAMTFCVAYSDGVAAGCGALRPLAQGSAELKRFYVDPVLRGRGIATRLLGYLESKARQAGVASLRLETGPKQPAAIALYRKCGYTEIEAYGEYVGCPHSYCMEKSLAGLACSAPV